MNREQGGSDSTSSAEVPVISIHRNSNASEEAVRTSLSYSNLEKDKPLPSEPPSLNEGSSNLFRDDDDTIVFSGNGHHSL